MTNSSAERTASPVRLERLSDGSILLQSPERLEPYPSSIGTYVDFWADEAPGRPFLVDRNAKSGPPAVTYGEARQKTRSIAQALLDRGLSQDRPVMILSGNGIGHALLTLACLYAGIPVTPVSPAYSLMSRDLTKLKSVHAAVEPGLVYVSDESAFARALEAVHADDEQVVAGFGRGQGGRLGLEDLASARPGPEVDEAASRITYDTVAKILFTSGSTDLPKGVVNTHRMMCSNQQMIAQIWPFLAETPPVLVDWLPWHHTFGGNHNFNLVLRNGGTLHMDRGRPVGDEIEVTVRNLKETPPTVYFNVPRGYAALLPYFERDAEFRERFFSRLELLFSAAAALPQSTFDRLVEISKEARGFPILMGSGWGCTETAPLVTGVGYRTSRSEVIGLPAPGVDLKLAPVAEKYELRVRGPNVTPGYLDRQQTEIAFDEDGFYCTGDAGRFADSEDIGKGLVFDGRLKEDFKLETGTWVQAGRIRVEAVTAASPLIKDAVVCGHNREYIGLLAWPDPEGCHTVLGLPADSSLDELVSSKQVQTAIAERLSERNRHNKGSSTRIRRFLLLAEPPSLEANEITDKGYINQRACLERRADDVERLFTDPVPPNVIEM